MAKSFTSEQLAQAYKNACMSELQALKPGNVHVFADGHGMTIHDFIKSADASAAVIAQPGLSVGERIYAAIEATQAAVGLNTNLGLVLLCAPLIQAALDGGKEQSLEMNLSAVLSHLTINDAILTAQAIVLANPAGLGSVSEHDVHQPPQVTLLDLMRSAQHQDRIALQYANNFHDVLGFGLRCNGEAMTKWQNQAWATTALYLGFVSRQLDTHIVRKYGNEVAEAVMIEAQAMEVAHRLAENPKLIQKQLLEWDASLKKRNINPGTSADLTVATLLASFLV
jgi:triphosphoribosyl-dephospho-CoA synthase